jgi:dolichol-phosphate mannosyltransferase
MFLSIVIPVYNEAATLPMLFDRLLSTKDNLSNVVMQFIFVDDHSTDNSSELLKNFCLQHPFSKMIRLSKNSGSHVAIIAGLQLAEGDCALFMASDLQDPPELIRQLIDQWKAGNHIVWAVRAERQGIALSEKIFSNLTQKLISSLAGSKIILPPANADFALLDKKAVNAFLASVGSNPSLGVLISNLGFKTSEVAYIKAARQHGKSKWTLGKKLKAFADMFVASSFAPIRLMSYLGIACCLLGFIYGAKVIVEKLYQSISTDNTSLILVFILIIGGVQLLMLGILGEYLWRSLKESEKKPLYFVESEVNIVTTKREEK